MTTLLKFGEKIKTSQNTSLGSLSAVKEKIHVGPWMANTSTLSTSCVKASVITNCQTNGELWHFNRMFSCHLSSPPAIFLSLSLSFHEQLNSYSPVLPSNLSLTLLALNDLDNVEIISVFASMVDWFSLCWSIKIQPWCPENGALRNPCKDSFKARFKAPTSGSTFDGESGEFWCPIWHWEANVPVQNNGELDHKCSCC